MVVRAGGHKPGGGKVEDDGSGGGGGQGRYGRLTEGTKKEHSWYGAPVENKT